MKNNAILKCILFFAITAALFGIYYGITVFMQPREFALGTLSDLPMEYYIDPDEVYYLSGKLECYPKVMIPPNNFGSYEPIKLQLDSLGEVRQEACRDGDNYVATVRFYVNAPARLEYALIIPGEFCEYIFFVNRTPVKYTDTFRSDSPRYPSPHVIKLPKAEDGGYEIIMYVITPVTSISSTPGTILFGTADKISSVRVGGISTSLVIACFVLVTVVFYLIQLLAMKRDKVVLSFVLMATAFLIRSLMVDDVLIVKLFPTLQYQVGMLLKSMSYPILLLSVVYHEYCMYPTAFRKTTTYAACILLVLPLINSLTLRKFPALEYAMYASCFLVFLLMVIALLRALAANSPYSFMFSLGLAQLIASGFIEAFTARLPVAGRYISAFPLIMFTAIELLMLAQRYLTQSEAEIYYTEELNRTLEAMQASENAFLNAQMKPHFLYNTLNTIADLCVTDPDKAKSLIASLKEYCNLILSIDNMEKTVPLSRELELVTAYTSIEKERFPSINFYTDLPIRMPKINMPPLTLQPLIENAIKHGVRKNDRPGVITLRIREAFDSVTFYVSDNGVGMDEATMQKLFNEPKENKSIGVYNIDKRLKNLYGEGLSVDSTVDLGTCVSFTVPK